MWGLQYGAGASGSVRRTSPEAPPPSTADRGSTFKYGFWATVDVFDNDVAMRELAR